MSSAPVDVAVSISPIEVCSAQTAELVVPGPVSRSRSGGLVATASAPHGHHVGIDIERVAPRRNLMGLARRTMTDREWSRWRSLDDHDEQLVAFHQHWTFVEAVLKARGTGLAGGLRWRPPRHWCTAALVMPSGWVGTVALDAPAMRVAAQRE